LRGELAFLGCEAGFGRSGEPTVVTTFLAEILFLS
jgi:hypothetical protein